jgi:transcriptional regulator with XRE-family HTH domain
VKTIAELVGKNIRSRRGALGLSQTALAKSAKISNITLNRIEAGKQAPQGASLQMIADVLGCSPEDLYVTESAPAPHLSPELISAVRDAATEIANSNQYSGLSKDKQKLIALIASDGVDDATARIMLGYAGIETDDALGIETDAISDDKENSTPRTRR